MIYRLLDEEVRRQDAGERKDRKKYWLKRESGSVAQRTNSTERAQRYTAQSL